ncbi:MAG: hypothetical protein GX589_08815 [Deltaproteobacteria bacterium]|nr:hypothetical protein [Deltaproteobacteria bacterium]
MNWGVEQDSMSSQVRDRFGEVFEIEMSGWCYGIEKYPGEIFSGLVHAVIRELAPSFRAAIEHGYPFKVLDLASRISKSAKYLIHEKEIAFSILAQLPNPATLSGEDAQFTLAQVIDQVEQAYGGALERLQRKWHFDAKKVA